jgi:hypothetical protein
MLAQLRVVLGLRRQPLAFETFNIKRLDFFQLPLSEVVLESDCVVAIIQPRRFIRLGPGHVNLIDKTRQLHRTGVFLAVPTFKEVLLDLASACSASFLVRASGSDPL